MSGAGPVDRRAALARLVALAAAGGSWTAESLAQAMSAGTAAPAQGTSLEASAQRTLAAAADVIVPRTRTPGALQAGVPAFVAAVHAQWMTAEERAQFAAGLAALDQQARTVHGRSYARCRAAQRAELLRAAIAATAFAGGAMSLSRRIAAPDVPFALRLRDLVMFGYFTSQAGSVHAMRYLAAPGAFDGDLPLRQWPYQTVI